MGKLKNFVEENELNAEVFADVLQSCKDYDGTLKERMISYCNEVLQYGCKSGMVNSLIYYSDTVAFFEKFADEIAYLVDELCNSTGESVQSLFKGFDSSDPFFRYDYNKNLMAWFAYEEVCYKLVELLEEM